MSIFLGFSITLCLLEVDVLINIMLMYWTYLYALSYRASRGHSLIRTFQPFLANGLNEPTVTLLGDIIFIWPNIICQFTWFVLWLGCTPFLLQAYVQLGQTLGDRLVSSPSFSFLHELTAIWTHGRSGGLPMSLGVAKCTHWVRVCEWSYKDPHTLEWTYSPRFWAF
jgi:hypothetical protein